MLQDISAVSGCLCVLLTCLSRPVKWYGRACVPVYARVYMCVCVVRARLHGLLCVVCVRPGTHMFLGDVF